MKEKLQHYYIHGHPNRIQSHITPTVFAQGTSKKSLFPTRVIFFSTKKFGKHSPIVNISIYSLMTRKLLYWLYRFSVETCSEYVFKESLQFADRVKHPATEVDYPTGSLKLQKPPRIVALTLRSWAPCLDTPLFYRHYTVPFLTPIVHSSGGCVLTVLQTTFLSSQTILFVFHQKQQPKAMETVGINCSVWKPHLQYFSVQASQTI